MSNSCFHDGIRQKPIIFFQFPMKQKKSKKFQEISEEVNDLKKNIEGSTAAIVIFVLLFIVALVWAVVATVIAIVLHLKSGNVSASDGKLYLLF